MTTAPDVTHTADLVFEGGGVKGIGLAGAFSTLWERGYRPGRAAGTSAGAITAALVAAGYTGPELEQIVLHDMDFKLFADATHLGRMGEVTELVRTHGLHSGEYFLDWISKKLTAKGVTKFGDLKSESDAGTPDRAYQLQVIASDISARAMLVLPRDADQIGVDPDQLEVATAVRMSMSIPVFFRPMTAKDRQGREHTIVDGGMLSNYPIWLFDCPPDRPPSYPTFGMLLVAPNQKAALLPDPPAADALGPVTSPIDFSMALAETMMEAHDRLYVDEANYARTIPIPTEGVKTTEFGISAAQATGLFHSGSTAAAQFLDGWDFAEYIAKFRTAGGAVPSRRARILDPAGPR
jgi:NTE family protein